MILGILGSGELGQHLYNVELLRGIRDPVIPGWYEGRHRGLVNEWQNYGEGRAVSLLLEVRELFLVF